MASCAIHCRLFAFLKHCACFLAITAGGAPAPTLPIVPLGSPMHVPHTGPSPHVPLLPPHLQLAPQDIPYAATALHKLARKFTKALTSRLGESRYLLHPALDELDDWLHPTMSSRQRVHSQ